MPKIKLYKNWEDVPTVMKTVMDEWFNIRSVADFLTAVESLDLDAAGFNPRNYAPIGNSSSKYEIVIPILKRRGPTRKVLGSMFASFAPQLNIHDKLYDMSVPRTDWYYYPCIADPAVWERRKKAGKSWEPWKHFTPIEEKA
jgi:hypothetical protein